MAEDIDAELQAYQEELDRQRLAAQRQKSTASDLAATAVKNQARRAAKQVGKKVAKQAVKAGARYAATAAGSALAALSAPVWGTILAIIGALIAIVVLSIALIMGVLIVGCNSDSLKVKLAIYSTFPEGVCEPFYQFSGAVNSFENIEVPGDISGANTQNNPAAQSVRQ